MHRKNTTSAKTISGAALLASSLLLGCTTDDAVDSGTTGGSSGEAGAATSGAGSGGSGGTTNSGGSAGTGPSICDTKAPVTATPIATFDGCTLGVSDEAATTDCTVSEIGGTSLFGGVFFYDDGTGNPTFSIDDGHTSGALGLASTEPATEYGGGFGVWTTGCFDASEYDGITFWTRGIAPNGGEATVTLLMAETTPSEPEAGSTNRGTCSGTIDQCTSPKFSFPVTDSWTQVHAPWSGFAAGNANGTPVTATGNNIYQLQWDIGLLFTPDTEGDYVAEPAPYELQIDDVAFE
jgi:hypothetical protein